MHLLDKLSLLKIIYSLFVLYYNFRGEFEFCFWRFSGYFRGKLAFRKRPLTKTVKLFSKTDLVDIWTLRNATSKDLYYRKFHASSFPKRILNFVFVLINYKNFLILFKLQKSVQFVKFPAFCFSVIRSHRKKSFSRSL